jgi:hypothetical protein
MKPLLAVVLLAPSCLWGQNPHPRIWLDSATLTRLNSLVSANDPTWVALKGTADTYVSYTVPAYDRSNCSANQICYTYEGEGWLDAIEPLALAYKLTGNTAYSDQVKAILNVMVAAGAAPVEVDDGFPSRSAVLGLALAYDWIYDQLSATDKTNICRLLDSYWAWVQASGYQWSTSGGSPNAYANYFGGHMLGYGLAALAVEGDDANSPAMQSVILNNFNAYVVPAFSSGAYQGGYTIESYNYGGNHFLRLFQYMRAMKTAGKMDLLTQYIAWVKKCAQNTLYELRPDLWSVTDEGGWTGSYVRVLYQNYPLTLAGLLNGTTEGQWMQQLYKNMTIPPGVPSSVYAPSTFETLFFNTGQTPVDYTATQPTYNFSAGDQHTITRGSWATSAVHTTFNGGTMRYADHQSRSSGHVSIERGSDYLLINGGEWAGQTGLTSDPQTDDQANWHLNTLFYWDGGTNCLSQTSSDGQYAGCQQFWPTTNTVTHLEAPAYTFSKANLRPAYLNNNGLTTLNTYYRTFVNIGGDVSFVFDRIGVDSAAYTRKLEWHTPGPTTRTPAGSATAISVNGNIASATVGNSTLWIGTLLPASPTIAQVQDAQIFGSTTKMSTQRFEVSDPNAGSSTSSLFLTVLAPTASSVSSMPPVSLIDTGNYRGAFYNDGTLPRIALFSADGTAQTSVNYTATYSSSLTGTHVILDMVPGTYSVTRDGTAIYSGLTVGSDGSLSFTSTGGLTYAIQASGSAPDFTLSATPGSQTVNQGGSTSYTVSVGALNGFMDNVSFSVSGLPNGASSSFLTIAPGSTTLTVNTGSAAGGSYTVTITGTGPSTSHSTTVNLVVTSPPANFSIYVSPTSRTVAHGSSTTYTVTLTPTNGFTGNVSLSVSGLPPNTSSSFRSNPVTISGGSISSTVTISTKRSTSRGTATLTIRGTSGSLSHKFQVGLTVN